MIDRPTNWENVQEMTERPKLPLGAYECKIAKVIVQVNLDGGKQLNVFFDISAGEYAGYYAADYKANTREDKKWKGCLRVWLPRNDGSEKDEWTKSTLKGFISSVEKSNPGFVFNWDERTLAGKAVGILYRNEEWSYEGKQGWIARPFRGLPISNVRDGDFKLPKDKPLKNTTYATPPTTELGGIGNDNPFASAGSFGFDDFGGELPF